MERDAAEEDLADHQEAIPELVVPTKGVFTVAVPNTQCTSVTLSTGILLATHVTPNDQGSTTGTTLPPVLLSIALHKKQIHAFLPRLVKIMIPTGWALA